MASYRNPRLARQWQFTYRQFQVSLSPHHHNIHRASFQTDNSGTPFSINYSVNTTPATPCKYIFFRLYMNARPIAAWGIDPTVRPKGKVVKSLWSPCRLYTDRIGFEGRNFVFLPGQEFKSVAEDGGLIEIQVFRAKERRVRAPKLEEFKFQENYGIALVFSLLDFMLFRPLTNPSARLALAFLTSRRMRAFTIGIS